MIQTKRVYERITSADGARFLVDRFWPRGVTKKALRLRAWAREVAPSNRLRRWYAHDPVRWKEFQRRYWAELEKKKVSWRPILDAARAGKATLLFSARDEEHNNAVVLKAFLETAFLETRIEQRVA